ncbi:MAG: nuclear transport factor 2 family protein [Candidatus Hodarchaeales archaeon]|jgi:hypothetical protein
MNPVDKQLRFYNERNLEAFVECYSDDIEVFMLESNDIITKGKEQLRKSMKDSFESKPDAKTLVISRSYQNNLIIDLEKITGYVEGKVITVVAIYQVLDNKITKLWFGGRLVE